MSHITTISTDVEFKDEILLVEALDQCEGIVDQTVFDYYGKRQNVDHAVHTKEFAKGIGFKRTGNKFEVRMDTYGKQNQAKKLLNQIQMKYQKASVVKRVKSMGYNIQVNEGESRIQLKAKVY